MSTPKYFKPYPNLKWPIKVNKAGQATYIQIKDYFHLLRIRDDIFKKDTLYYKHVVSNGQRPDQIAYDIYGNESWYWVVLLANDIVDYYNEWPLSFQELEKYILKKYGSYEKAGEVRHYETVDEYDGEGNLVMHGGLIVSKDFYYEYPVTPGGTLTKTSFPVGISHRDYEERININKSHINLIHKKHVPDIIRDVNNYATSIKMSTREAFIPSY